MLEVVASLAHRHRLDERQAAELAEVVRERLAADDCRLLREYGGRASLRTYLLVTVQAIGAGWLSERQQQADHPPRQGSAAPAPAPGSGQGEVDPTAAVGEPAAAALAAFLARQPPRDRLLLRLCLGEEVPLAALAGLWAVPEARLRRRLTGLTEQLRDQLRLALGREVELRELLARRRVAGRDPAAGAAERARSGETAVVRPSKKIDEGSEWLRRG